jgi:hypothetical protein
MSSPQKTWKQFTKYVTSHTRINVILTLNLNEDPPRIAALVLLRPSRIHGVQDGSVSHKTIFCTTWYSLKITIASSITWFTHLPQAFRDNNSMVPLLKQSPEGDYAFSVFCHYRFSEGSAEMKLGQSNFETEIFIRNSPIVIDQYYHRWEAFKTCNSGLSSIKVPRWLR